MEMTPYLTFAGTCAEAFQFYAEVFGGEIELVQLVKDGPMAADMADEVQDQVMHARVRIGERLLMGSDAVMGDHKPAQGFHVQVAFGDVERASRVFSRLARRGTVEMAFGPTFWSAGFGSCRDRFGVPWMINCDQPGSA